VTNTSQTAQIYERLRAAILTIDLAPGERLTERGLEASFDASRTPVRAALVRLGTEGLVQREGRGWIVAPIDLVEIGALAELREAVETAVVRLAVARASAEDIAALSDLVDGSREGSGEGTGEGDGLGLDDRDGDGPHDGGGGDGLGHGPRDGGSGHHGAETNAARDSAAEEGVRAGTDFHVELARLSGNPFLVDSVGGAMTRLARTRWLEVRTPEARDQAWAEHRALVDAVAARDADAAASLAAAHIRGTNERLLAALSADYRRLRGQGVAVTV
jgi:DNA-binding GntR family transcriptional regulator